LLESRNKRAQSSLALNQIGGGSRSVTFARGSVNLDARAKFESVAHGQRRRRQRLAVRTTRKLQLQENYPWYLSEFPSPSLRQRGRLPLWPRPPPLV